MKIHSSCEIEDFVYIAPLVVHLRTRAPLRGRLTLPATLAQGIIHTTKSEGGRKKRPMIWCNKLFDNAKSYWCRAEIALCYACWQCHVLIGGMGVICEKKEKREAGRERTINQERKKASKQQYTRTYRYI